MFFNTFNDSLLDMERWRDAYVGGRDFVVKYLRRFPKEDTEEFAIRTDLTYNPRFAKEAVNEVKDSIIHRSPDILRTGGPASYQAAVAGKNGGVDYRGSTMNMFLGDKILPELLPMRLVGVLVDNFTDNELGVTEADKEGKHPYFRIIPREDIVSVFPEAPINGYEKVILRLGIPERDEYGKQNSVKQKYLYYEKLKNGVKVVIGDEIGSGETVILDIPEIPFHLFELRQSLMEDVCDYQISLLNIESSDIQFIRKSNFPIFYEFYKAKGGGGNYGKQNTDSGDKEITLGAGAGRQYPADLEKPGFVAPDPDSLRAAMEKELQMKQDIRTLVRLNLSALDPIRQSKDSKVFDDRSLESGLCQIGNVLSQGETKLAAFWASFEGGVEPASISYPRTYNLQTEPDRFDQAKVLLDLSTQVPSRTFRKEMQKASVVKLIGHLVPRNILDDIMDEIDKAKTQISDPNILLSTQKAGLIGDEDCAESLQIDPKSVEQAKKDRAERIALAMEAQGGMEQASADRGAPEFDKGKPKESKGDGRGKQDNTNMGGN